MFYFTKKRFIEFCKRDRLLIVFSTLLILFCYGAKIAYQTISADMEILLDDPRKIYEQWLAVHRWGMIVYKWFTGTMSFNMPLETALLFLNLVLAAVVYTFMLDTLTNGKCKAGLYVFTIIFLTHPVWGEQFVYMAQAAGNSFALLLAAVAVMLFTDGVFGKRPIRIITGFLAGVFCYGTYQSYDLVVTAIVLAVYMLLMKDNRFRAGQRALLGLFYVIYLAVVRIAASAVAFASVNDLGNSQYRNYLEEQIRWGKDSAWECWKTIGGGLVRLLFAGDVCYNVLFAAAIVAAVAAYVISVKKYRGWPFMLIALLIMIAVPFVRLFRTASEPAIRSNLAMTFVAAFLCFYVLTEVTARWLMWVLCVPALYVGFRQIETVHRINYTENVRYEQDLALVHDIWDQVEELNLGDTSEYPLVIVGSYQAPLNDACMEERELSIAGRSVFEMEETSRSRVSALFRDLGYKVADGTDEQYELAVSLSGSMPESAYASEGFVTCTNCIIIVNMDRFGTVGENAVQGTAEDHATYLLGGE